MCVFVLGDGLKSFLAELESLTWEEKSSYKNFIAGLLPIVLS